MNSYRQYSFLSGIAEVDIPNSLDIKINEEKGLVNFGFEPSIGLPYLEEDSGKETWRRDFEIGDLSNAILRATMPEFFGEKMDSFYEHSCNRPVGNPNYGNTRGVPLKQYLMGQQPHGYVLGFEHRDEDTIAYLHVDCHTTQGWGDRSSGLVEGSVFGRVFPQVKISHPKENHVYCVSIVNGILGGLLDRRRARDLSYARGSLYNRPAIFIKNPTKERMQTALKHAKDIENFFRDHNQDLQAVADLYSTERDVLARMVLMILSRKFPRDLAEMEERVPELKPWH